jgi:hypothetical protein
MAVAGPRAKHEVFLRPVPWRVWLLFCLVAGTVAGWLALGPAAGSAAGVAVFAVVGAALLTPWQVAHHRLLSWGAEVQADFQTKVIRVSTVLGIATRNGIGGWVLGTIVTALVPWIVPGGGPAIRVGLGGALGLTLGAIYRVLPGPGDRTGVGADASRAADPAV